MVCDESSGSESSGWRATPSHPCFTSQYPTLMGMAVEILIGSTCGVKAGTMGAMAMSHLEGCAGCFVVQCHPTSCFHILHPVFTMTILTDLAYLRPLLCIVPHICPTYLPHAHDMMYADSVSRLQSDLRSRIHIFTSWLALAGIGGAGVLELIFTLSSKRTIFPLVGDGGRAC